MIPILYSKNESTFSHNGYGLLADTIKATVTEERNGAYELSLQYPITGQWYDKIAEGCIIKAKANETSEPQLFRIYKSSKPLKGVVTFSAEHISYDLNGIPTLGFSIKSATPQMAMTRAIDEAGLPCPFTAISDISTLNSTEIVTPCSVRAILGGQTGSILDVWGGEFEFDNFVIKLHKNRGEDNGVLIEYGKNLYDLTQEANIAECYTHIMPYAVYTKEGDDEDGESQEVYVFLPEKVLPLPSAENIGHSKACIMDFSGKFSENAVITETALRQKATAYAKSATLGVPKVSITVSFVQLWQTEEYKNIAPLERVKLCDTVTVRFPSLGVKASAKVIKTVYNVLEEKYESIELGDAKSSLADTLNKQQADIAQLAESIIKGNAKVTDELKKAVKNATELITGQAGGYVVLNPAEKPQEILILDKPAIEEAVSVWRWNSAGLGHSSTGYNGTYALAMTMDGAFVADFITVGTLNGALLKADSVQASAISAEYKQEVTDAIGNVESSVTQAFKISDEQLLSKISETKTYAEQQAQTAENAANEATDEKLSNYSSTIEMNSAIEQKANSITLSVSEQVSETKTYAEQQAQAAENAANKATDKKLSEYSTTTEMNSAIEQKANSITLSVSEQVSETKTYAEQQAQAAENAANKATDKKLSKYSTTTEMNSAIEVVSNRLALLVTETDNGDVINSASIIAAINDGESGITLNANKINLTAYPKTTDLSLSVTNDYGGDEKKSRLYLKCDGKTVDSATISLTGIVSFTDLEESGSTVINGDNVTTGTISADYISTEISQVNGNLYVGNYGDNVSKQIIFSKGAKISTVSESIGGYYGLSISGVVVKIGTRLDLTDCTDISWGDNYPTAKFG